MACVLTRKIKGAYQRLRSFSARNIDAYFVLRLGLKIIGKPHKQGYLKPHKEGYLRNLNEQFWKKFRTSQRGFKNLSMKFSLCFM